LIASVDLKRRVAVSTAVLMELLNIIVEEEIDVDVLFKGEEIGLVNKNCVDWECEHNVFIGKC
jgi:hypothetical protein